MLATAVSIEATSIRIQSCTGDFRCDNCRHEPYFSTSLLPLRQVEITEVRDCDISRPTNVDRNPITTFALHCLQFKNRSCRFKSASIDAKLQKYDFPNGIPDSLHVFARNVPLSQAQFGDLPPTLLLELESTHQVASESLCDDNRDTTTYDAPPLPFLFKFEMQRYGVGNDEDLAIEVATASDETIEARCKCIQSWAEKKGTALASLSPQSLADLEMVFYRCQLPAEGPVKLLPPCRAYHRRIYNFFGGSDRFLEMTLEGSLSKDLAFRQKVLSILRDGLQLCGRKYGFVWCKKDKNPQSYVLFAEEGKLCLSLANFLCAFITHIHK
jgi:hypothetical protein